MTPDQEWVHYSSRRAKLGKIVLAGDPNCWLCGQPGADSIDHVLPKHTHRELMWDLGNMKPAHGSCNSSKGAGTGPAGVGPRSRSDW